MTVAPAVFIAFLASIVFIYWSIPSRWSCQRANLIVTASAVMVFLISPTALFVAVTTGITASACSMYLARRPSAPVMWASVVLILAILVTARFSSAYHVNFIDLAGSAFFTLKALSIVSDAYRYSRTTQPLDALFLILFFPTYEAGPIEQPKTLNRSSCNVPLDFNDILVGSARIAVGLAKQSFIGAVVIAGLAERISPWNSPSSGGVDQLWLLVWIILIWAQLYVVFSGYTDVAIGSARLFGIRVRENFNLPFLARNLQDFWKRWHISLIDFMSEYVYKPFVRKTGWRYRGILLLFLLTGLWHAMNLQYLLWGVFHGTAMMAMARWQRSEVGDRFRVWVASSKTRSIAFDTFSRCGTVFFVAWLSAIGGAGTWERALFILALGKTDLFGF